MELNDFVSKFGAQFDETPISEFTASTIFSNLDEWSSLSALSIIAMADEEYQIRITGDDIRSVETIEDLFNIVKSRL